MDCSFHEKSYKLLYSFNLQFSCRFLTCKHGLLPLTKGATTRAIRIMMESAPGEKSGEKSPQEAVEQLARIQEARKQVL